MYPSGPWRGFWEQRWLGRQPMRELMLRFTDGRVEGKGIDVVGPFTFEGTYDGDGKVHLLKDYRRHQVHYAGKYDGEGTVYGEWSIGETWRGLFVLTPERFAVPANAEIRDISATPDA